MNGVIELLQSDSKAILPKNFLLSCLYRKLFTTEDFSLNNTPTKENECLEGILNKKMTQHLPVIND